MNKCIPFALPVLRSPLGMEIPINKWDVEYLIGKNLVKKGMNNNLIVKSIGRLLVWFWIRHIKNKKIEYEDIDYYYSIWLFLGVGCLFFGIIVGITLLYFYYH